MPYIEQEKRNKYDSSIDNLVTELSYDHDNFEEDMTYIFTKLISSFLGDEITNKKINAIKGVIDSCKSEFEDKISKPYKELKSKENGDIYPDIIDDEEHGRTIIN